MQAKLGRQAFGLLRPVIVAALANMAFVAVLVALTAVLSAMTGFSAALRWLFGFAFFAAPVGILIWAGCDLGRRRWSAALAIAVIALGAWGVIAAYDALFEAGNRLAFAINRPAYDRLVAEWKAGRLSGERHPGGWIEGRRYGVHYTFRPGEPESLRFNWVEDGVLWNGVEVHERGCPELTHANYCSRGTHLAGPYYYFELIA